MLIVVVKKTFRYSKVFFLQPLMPKFCISEHYYGERYKWINVILFLLLLLMNSAYSNAQEPGPSEDPIIMRIIKLDYAEAEQLVLTLEPFLSPQGRIMAYTPTNSLIIKDRRSIVEKLIRVIKGKLNP